MHWVNSMGTPVFDSEGNPEFADGTMFDITEQKLAAVELAEAREAADEALGELENVSSVILRWHPTPRLLQSIPMALIYSDFRKRN